MAKDIQINKAGIEAFLKSQQVRDLLTSVAEPMADDLRTNAPVESGEYADSITVEQDTTDRAVVRIVVGVAHAVPVEAEQGPMTAMVMRQAG